MHRPLVDGQRVADSCRGMAIRAYGAAMWRRRVTASFTALVAAGSTALVAIEPPDVGPSGRRAVAEKDVDAIERHAGPRVNYLREDGVSSGADILRGAANAHAAVVAKFHAWRCRECAPRPTMRPPVPSQSPCRRGASSRLPACAASSRSFPRRWYSTPSGGAKRREDSCLHRVRHRSSSGAPADPS